MPRNYLITGGSGFLGSGLVRRLVAKGHHVRVLDNGSRGSTDRLSDILPSIEFVTGDVRDAATVANAARGVDSVCHLAFINGTEFFYSKPDLVLDVAVRGMISVLSGCIENGVRELVLASSSEVYQTPPVVPTPEDVPLTVPDVLNPRYSYGGGKIISELMAIHNARHFDRVLIFRPHNVYGPDMGWEHVIPQFVLRMSQLVEKGQNPVRFPIQGTGEETRAFVFIDDFLDGLMLVIEHGEHMGIYHIGSREEITIAEVARLVAAYFKRSVQIVPGERARGSTLRRCPDISKLEALGYLPTRSIRDYLPRVAEWYVQHAPVHAEKAATGK